jgi:SNF2 family DNA or RNA helicase
MSNIFKKLVWYSKIINEDNQILKDVSYHQLIELFFKSDLLDYDSLLHKSNNNIKDNYLCFDYDYHLIGNDCKKFCNEIDENLVYYLKDYEYFIFISNHNNGKHKYKRLTFFIDILFSYNDIIDILNDKLELCSGPITDKTFIINILYRHSLYGPDMFKDLTNNIGLDDKDISDILQSINKPLTLPQINLEFINDNISLYKYQIENIKWMKYRELNTISHFIYPNGKRIIKLDDSFIYDLHQKKIIEETKIEFNGGAIIDDVGLGKTAQMLCLVAEETGDTKTTIGFIPDHLCSTWKNELNKFIIPNYLKVYNIFTIEDYYNYIENNHYDLILVNIDILSCEKFMDHIGFISTNDNMYRSYKNNKLLDKIYHRIFVDEFHEFYNNVYVKNIFSFINAKNRWIITATPFIHQKENCNDSLFYILQFLVNIPTIQFTYNYSIKYRFMFDLYSNIFRKNRKTDITTDLFLPNISEEICLFDLTKNEQILYDAENMNSNSRNIEYLRHICSNVNLCITRDNNQILSFGEAKTNIIKIVESNIITYNKQHVELKKKYDETYQLFLNILIELDIDIHNINENVLSNSNKIRYNYNIIQQQKNEIDQLNKIINEREKSLQFIKNTLENIEQQIIVRNNDVDSEQCVICCENFVKNISLIPCGHYFCHDCLNGSKKFSMFCPKCRSHFENSSIQTFRINNDFLDEYEKYGSKITLLINYLKKTNMKTIIFTEWDNMVDIINNILNNNGLKSLIMKDNILEIFNNDKSYSNLILSHKRFASGLNITSAEQIILMEPILGSYRSILELEQQIIGRSHRIGQTKKVHFVRFIAKATIEHEIFKKYRMCSELYTS